MAGPDCARQETRPRVRWKAASALLQLGAIGLAAAGCCTMAMGDGGEPLAPEELPEWARREISLQRRPDLLRAAASAIEADPRRYPGERAYTSPERLRRYDIGALLPPGYRDSGFLGVGGYFGGFGPMDYGPSLLGDGMPGHRFLYDRQRIQGLFPLFEVVTADIQRIEPGSGRSPVVLRIRSFLSLPYVSWASVGPADAPLPDFLQETIAGGREGSPDRYRVEDVQVFLLGLFGWGRVNRTRYLQFLWIPIPIGEEEIPAIHR